MQPARKSLLWPWLLLITAAVSCSLPFISTETPTPGVSVSLPPLSTQTPPKPLPTDSLSPGSRSTAPSTPFLAFTKAPPTATNRVLTATATLLSVPNIETLTAACPSAAEIAEINRRLKISFEFDPTAGKLVCRAANGSADLTRLQERTYQAILAMKSLKFNRNLPWTEKTLYDWFISSVQGIRFRDSIPYSYCCEPENIINILPKNLNALEVNRWLGTNGECALSCFMVLLVHEARHNNGKWHTCKDIDDNTVNEMGAWGVQYALYYWLGTYTDPALMTSKDTAPDFYRQAMLNSARGVRNSRFCREPALAPNATLPPP